MSHMSTNKNITFPFSAIIGQEEMKKGFSQVDGSVEGERS